MKKIDVNMKILMTIIVLFALSLSLMAQPNQRQCQFQQKNPHGIAALDLTDEQKAEMKEIHLAQMKVTQPLMDEVKINKAKINALINKDNPDMKEIVSLVEANGKIMTQIQVKGIESKVQIRALLTDEQKVIFNNHGSKMQGKKAMVQHRSHRRTPGNCRF